MTRLQGQGCKAASRTIKGVVLDLFSGQDAELCGSYVYLRTEGMGMRKKEDEMTRRIKGKRGKTCL